MIHRHQPMAVFLLAVLLCHSPIAGASDDERNAFPEALIEAMGIPLATDFRGFDPDGEHRPDRAPWAGSNRPYAAVWIWTSTTAARWKRISSDWRSPVRNTRKA